MSILLTCPHGHQWEPVQDGSGVFSDQQQRCPVCGAQGESFAEDSDATDIFVDHPGPAADDMAVTLPPTGQAPLLITSFTGTIPGYEILGELGRGGMGVIYKARQTKLKRMVALKMVLSGSQASLRELYRFRTEAEAVARLQHPNIVQIYEVNERDGLPYIALEFVGGGSLAQRMAGTPQPAEKAAAMVEALARAIHFAHEHGIIHRDLKPANILLTAEGTPKIADFGLAKQVGEIGLTQTEALMGTPSYMAPEQVTGGSKDVGPAADIYSLGVILYEMLTGQVPFRGENKMATLEQVRSQEPVAPSRLQPRVPRDLDTICLQCLQKEPPRRYATAQAFADDLHRFLHHEPIRARPIGFVDRSRKWLRRRPLVAGLLAGLLLLFVVSFVGITWSYVRAERALEAAVQDKQAAVEAREQAEANVYYSAIAQARLEWQASNAAQARLLLNRIDPQRREWEWFHLRDRFNTELLRIDAHRPFLAPQLDVLFHTSPFLSSIAFSPDGTWLASAGGGNLFYASQGGTSIRPGEIMLWDARTGRTRERLLGHQNLLQCVCISPDGGRLASTSDDGTVRVWEARSGLSVHQLTGHAGIVHGAGFSPDGHQLVTGGSDRTVRFWHLADGKEVGPAIEATAAVRCVAFSPDGHRIAAGLDEGTITLWDTKARQTLSTLRGHTGLISSVAFGSDRRYLASSSHDGTARVWDAKTGDPVFTLVGHGSIVHQIAFRPDGQTVATAGGDGTIRLWNLSDGRESLVLRGHERSVQSVSFHPGGHQLVSAAYDGTLRLWDLTEHPEYRQVPFSPPNHGGGEVEALGFDASSQHLLVANRGGVVHRRDVGSGVARSVRRVEATGAALTPATLFAFSGDGRRIVTATGNPPQMLKVWDVASGQLRQTLPDAYEGSIWRLAINADGSRVAAYGWRVDDVPGIVRTIQIIRVWDVATGQLLTDTTERGYQGVPRPNVQGREVAARPGVLALSPDGRLLAYDETPLVGDDPAAGYIKIHDIDRRQPVRNIIGFGTGVIAFAFSPDSRHAAISERAGNVCVWPLDEEYPRFFVACPEPVWDLCFSPNGRRLAGATRNFVTLWDAATGQEVITLHGTPKQSGDYGYNPRVVFSPDGRKLAANGWLHGATTVSLWDATPPTDDAARQRRQAAEHRAFGWHFEHSRNYLDGDQTFAADVHLKALAKLEPPAAYLARLRGNLFGIRRDWPRALADYATAFRMEPSEDAQDGCVYALLLLRENDLASYQRLVEQMQIRFGDATAITSLNLAYHVKTAALHPESPTTPAQLIELAEKHLQDVSHLSYALEALALVHYRHGNYRQALDECRSIIALSSKTPPYATWLLLAMAHQRLGSADESHRWLAKLNEHRDELRTVPLQWSLQLEVEVLEKDAKELGRGKGVNGR